MKFPFPDLWERLLATIIEARRVSHWRGASPRGILHDIQSFSTGDSF